MPAVPSRAVRRGAALVVGCLLASACSPAPDRSQTQGDRPPEVARAEVGAPRLAVGPDSAAAPATDASAPPPRLRTLFAGQQATPLVLRHLTQDHVTDTYHLHQKADGVIVTADPANRSTPEGSATRAVIWPPASAATLDATTCATWARSSPWGQEGLALRVRTDGDRIRAIVVAKNTIYGASWQFNVYSWDSGRDPYFQTHGAVDLTGVFTEDGKAKQLPWRVCARTEGSLVRIKGWAADEAQPGWTSSTHTGTVALPSWLTYEGKAGWYAAHIDPGDLLALADLRSYARTPAA